MNANELSVLSLIHDEVKGAREDMKKVTEIVIEHGQKLAVLEDRSNRVKWTAGLGAFGSVLAGAIAWMKGS